MGKYKNQMAKIFQISSNHTNEILRATNYLFKLQYDGMYLQNLA